MEKFKSRKFIVAMVTVLATMIAVASGMELPEEQIESVAQVIMVYLGGQAAVDYKAESKKS